MISVILAVMNRTERVVQILESWARNEIIGEIVICDWSSKEELYNIIEIKQILDKYDKIKIVRLDNEKNYNVSKACNLAYKFTNSNFKYLLKIDADYLLKDNSLFDILFSYNLDKRFIGGNTTTQEQWYCYYGFFFIKKKYYPTFNENLLATYGEEDVELYTRTCRIYKLNCCSIDLPKYVYHIPHNSNLRYANYNIKHQINRSQFNKSKFNKWYPQQYEIVEQKDQYVKVKKKEKNENTQDNSSILEYNRITFSGPATVFQNPPKNKY